MLSMHSAMLLRMSLLLTTIIPASYAQPRGVDHQDLKHNDHLNATGFPSYVMPLSNGESAFPKARHRISAKGHIQGTASLPPPSANLTLKSFSVVRGTWNYTCANETIAPSTMGGIATVFSPYPPAHHLTQEEFHHFSASLVNRSIDEVAARLDVIGEFYQLELHLGVTNVGNVTHFLGTLDAEIDAPDTAPVGPNGEPALIWAKFRDLPGSFGGVEAYRLNSAGGVAPSSCAGLGPHFELPFSSESWIYA